MATFRCLDTQHTEEHINTCAWSLLTHPVHSKRYWYTYKQHLNSLKKQLNLTSTQLDILGEECLQVNAQMRSCFSVFKTPEMSNDMEMIEVKYAA